MSLVGLNLKPKKEIQILESPKKKIKRNRHENHQSRSSTFNIPDDVLEKIFSLLPITSVFEIGLLSTSFHNLWASNTYLHFDEDFFERHQKIEDYIEVVDRILNFHSGPKVCSFRLFFKEPNENYSKVEEWIRIANGKGVQEIDLDFCINSRWVPTVYFLFECASVKVLKLSRCNFEIPYNFCGFHSLTTLVLNKVRGFDINYLIEKVVFRNCLALETLEIHEYYSTYNNLTIAAQNLKRFKTLKVTSSYLHVIHLNSPTLSSLLCLGRKFGELKVSGDVSKLNDVMLNFTAVIESGQMSNPLLHLSHINILTINSPFLEVMRRTPFELQNLKEFQLLMEPTSYCNVSDIVKYLKNFPSLEKVFIDMQASSFRTALAWENFEDFDHYDKFHHLKYVKVKGFNYEKYDQVQLVKFFLEKAMCLETLALVTSRNHRQKTHLQDVEICDSVFGSSSRASTNAKVVVFGYSRDDSCLHPTHTNISR